MEYAKLSQERKEERKAGSSALWTFLCFRSHLSGNDTEGAVLLLGGVGGTWLKFAGLLILQEEQDS